MEQLEQQATSHEDGYQTTFTPTVAGSGGLEPNQSLFTLEWDATNEIGDVAITIPGVTGPVTIPQDAWGEASPAAIPFTPQGNPYVAQPLEEIAGQRRVAWLIAPDASGKPANALLPLARGAAHRRPHDGRGAQRQVDARRGVRPARGHGGHAFAAGQLQPGGLAGQVPDGRPGEHNH